MAKKKAKSASRTKVYASTSYESIPEVETCNICGPGTMFEVCGEKLPVLQQPSCEDLYQIVRLYSVKGFEDKDKVSTIISRGSPAIAAAANGYY